MIIVIANQKGGVGKSTIATNLAAILSAEHETMLIDHDTSHVSMNFFNRRKFHEHLSTYHTVAPKDYEDMQDLLELPKEMTVVDLGGFTDDLARAALVYADLVVVPTSASTQDMDGNIHFMETLDKLKDSGVPLHVAFLANNIDPRMKMPRVLEELDYITDRGYKILGAVPHYRVFSESHGNGMSVVEFAPESKAASCMSEMVKAVIKEAQDAK